MLKDSWINKQDGVDDVLAEDINSIANAVIDLENNGNSTSIEVDDIMSDTSTNPVQNKVAKKYVDDMVADFVSVSDDNEFQGVQIFQNLAVFEGGTVFPIPSVSDEAANKGYVDTAFENAKSDIVNEVLEALPVWIGGSY